LNAFFFVSIARRNKLFKTKLVQPFQLIIKRGPAITINLQVAQKNGGSTVAGAMLQHDLLLLDVKKLVLWNL
jgi:hypothetical protein